MAAEPVQPGLSSAAGHSTAAVLCTHCGLPVPAGLVAAGEVEPFCCQGCRTVYGVIRNCGLERYYRLRESVPDAAPQPARTTGRRYDEFDDPVFEQMHVREMPDGCRCVELFVEGMHCGACVWLLERLPVLAPQVIEARVDFRRSLLRVTWDPHAGPLSEVARALDSLGYPPHPARDAAARDWRRREDHRLLIRIGVAGALAGNVMMFAFCLYGGMFTGIEAAFEAYFRWMSMLLGLLSLAWPGSVFFRGAWAAIRTGASHLDLPIAIGLAAGGVAGVVNTALGRGEIYFDSLTMLVFLLLVGRWVQRQQQRRASDAVELLYSLTPSFARRVDADGVRDVPLEAVRPGDLVEARAGDTIPVDGEIESGQSSIDQSLLTGESTPREVCEGDAVSAGTVNLAAAVRIRARATGERSRVGQLMQMVERSARNTAPIVRTADRIARHFTAAMLALAAVTLLGWLRLDASRAVDQAMTLLLVTCPCALGLATPMIVTVAIGRAARRGILIKGGEMLEALSRRGTILLDKTGTVTQGRTTLLDWHGDESIKPLVAAIERHSAHPIARALVAAFPNVRGEEATCVTQFPGGGIEGRVDGRRIEIGSTQFIAERGARWPAWVADAVQRCAAEGRTPVLVAEEGEVRAVAAFGDPLREDARSAVAELRRLGWCVGLLSGDHRDVVASVARSLEIDPHDACGDAAPEQKLATVERRRREGPVVMVGDGVNDAAALAAATVGIAVNGGAEASLSAAHVYLSRPGLAPIVELIRAGRRTLSAIRRSFAVSIAYNAIAAGLAMTGVINPLIAAILMPLSSFTVVSLALAARTFEEPPCP
ncbi:MAG: heavy metal translocating P-type ATPase [Phycisphaerae bacterium]